MKTTKVPLPSDTEENPSTKSPVKVIRRIGFQRPYSIDQISSWIIHTLTTLIFYYLSILCFKFGSGDLQHECSILLSLHLFFSSFLIINWISCENIDPSDDKEYKWFGITLTGERWEKIRYCAICQKRVIGLDHHCKWLHTCIGKNNYIQFYTISLCGLIIFLIQGLMGILSIQCLNEKENIPHSITISINICMVTLLVLSIPTFFAYVCLCIFHTHLFWKGYGTYDWLLKRRRQEREQKQRKLKENMKEIELSVHAPEDENTQHASL